MSNINNIDYKKKYLKYKKKYLQKKNLYLSGGSDDKIIIVEKIVYDNYFITLKKLLNRQYCTTELKPDKLNICNSLSELKPRELYYMNAYTISKFDIYIDHYTKWLQMYNPPNKNSVKNFFTIIITKSDETINNNNIEHNINTIKDYFKDFGITLINDIVIETQNQINKINNILPIYRNIKAILKNFPNTNDPNDTNLNTYIELYNKLYNNLHINTYERTYTKNTDYITDIIDYLYVENNDTEESNKIRNNMNELHTSVEEKLEIIKSELNNLLANTKYNDTYIFYRISYIIKNKNFDPEKKFLVCTMIDKIIALYDDDKSNLSKSLDKLNTILTKIETILK